MNQQDIVYLNHAGTSWPKPASVLSAESEFQRMPPTEWPNAFKSAIQTVADFFHVDRKRLLLTPSCTTALNLAISDHDWQTGDRVLTSQFEHHALYRNLLKLQPLGVEVTTIRPADNHPFSLAAFETELSKGAVKLVAVTAACNVTGILLPVEEITNTAHNHGVKVLIDGAQIAGWWNINLSTLGADLFTFAGHKGTQSPWGIGGLYVAPQTKMKCESAVCDLGPSASTHAATMPDYCDSGSVNLSALMGLAAGCDWLNSRENADRLPYARGLAAQFADQVRLIEGVQIFHDVEPHLKMPTVAITSDKIATAKLSAQLKNRGIICSGGLQCSPQSHEYLGTGKSGVARFSFGIGNSEQHVYAATNAIGELLAPYDS